MGHLLQEAFDGAESVICYLGKYTHRIAVSNSRIKGMTETCGQRLQKSWTLEGPCNLRGRIRPSVPDACPAEMFCTDSPLRAVALQRQSRKAHFMPESPGLQKISLPEERARCPGHDPFALRKRCLQMYFLRREDVDIFPRVALPVLRLHLLC